MHGELPVMHSLSSQCRTHDQPSSGAARIYGRLAWLDELRCVAIAMMILDHALLFFASGEVWAATIRLTLTRCAEPLFLFVFTYLTIYLSRPMRPVRWLQVALVSVFTSWVLSRFLGYPVADILASIAVVAPLLPLLLTIPRGWWVGGLYAATALAIFPVGAAGVVFDYSPALIVYQVLLVRLYCEEGHRGVARHGTLSASLLVMATAIFGPLGVTPSPSAFVVLFGHPLAAIAIKVFVNRDAHYSTPLKRLASKPLTVYATHLLVFAALAILLDARD